MRQQELTALLGPARFKIRQKKVPYSRYNTFIIDNKHFQDILAWHGKTRITTDKASGYLY